MCCGNGSVKRGILYTWKILDIYNTPDKYTEDNAVKECNRNGIHLNEAEYITYNWNKVKLNKLEFTLTN